MGTPFISGLDLRPLKSNLYPEANISQSLVLINSNRFNMGPTDNSIVRYPLDPHDRIWSTYDTIPSWTEISATSLVENYLTDAYDVPSAVMQTAATPINGSIIDLLWDPSDPSMNISSRYFFVLYFVELQNVPSNALWQFDIIGLPRYSISLVATKSATLPPILNAMEVYLTKPISDIATDPGDATAMMAIQEHFNVKKNWMGDPCAPKAFAWIGLNCTYPSSSLSRVKALVGNNGNLCGGGTACGSDTSNCKPLTWGQRLQIALDAAQGLEYLHVACKPALIHRDVKSRNILLTTNHGAKIADFGLTKAFSDSKTHITTEPAGTMRYLDPEYVLPKLPYQREKSDVYSFGVVLLELITGHSPVVPINESVSIHIGEWVHQNLIQVTIESIIDSRMGGEYDINSVWKVADLALRCKQEVSRERPTMTDVVAQIKESIQLEVHRDGRRNLALGSVSDDLGYLGEKRELEIGQIGEISGAAAGPALR
ncbi:hypothetical protein PR202_gb06240 [Eleusine coracana subsp. coracana]|uniref:Protein kinase domain-containing protein n=1 Tax=Eleusine coracana subsp. coracana TaxID=191504 RepID=A0AAV5E9E6_ELECO|nr:hypothetical protein PR202_gb06240 [Eleusine coracana subsp. coracana]